MLLVWYINFILELENQNDPSKQARLPDRGNEKTLESAKTQKK